MHKALNGLVPVVFILLNFSVGAFAADECTPTTCGPANQFAIQDNQTPGYLGIYCCANLICFGCPLGRVPNWYQSTAEPLTSNPLRKPVAVCGSIVQPENQAIGESIGITGTPFRLVYFSDRTAGRKEAYTAHINVTGPNVPSSVQTIGLNITIAGQSISKVFNGASNIVYDFTWDGKDQNGIPVSGYRNMHVSIMELSALNQPTDYPIFPKTFDAVLGNFDAKAAAKLGGWTISPQHFYDVVGKRLFMGDGTTRSGAAKTAANGQLYFSSEDASEVYFFDSSGRHLETRTGLIGALKYSFLYDAQGNLTTITDGSGNKTIISRLGNVPVSITSPFGQVTSITVDSNGYINSVKDPASQTYVITTAANGLISSFQKPQGQLSNMSYDSQGLLIKEIHAAGDLINLSRQNFTNYYTVSTQTALNRNSSYTYTQNIGGSSVIRKSTDPSQFFSNVTNGNVFTTGVDLTNNYLDSMGVQYNDISVPDKRFGFLSPSLEASSIVESNLVWSNEFSQNFVADPNLTAPFNILTLGTTETVNSNKFFKSIFDNPTRTITSTSPLNIQTKAVLDLQERPTSIQRGTLQPVTLSYNAKGQLSQTAQGVRATNLTYNAQGFTDTISNALNQSVHFTYNAAGKVLSETLPDGRVINFSYDKNGNLTSITPPSKPTHSFSLNGFELLSAYLPPALGSTPVSTGYVYNLDRQLTQINRPDGSQVAMNYNATTARLESISTPGGAFSYVYFPLDGSLSQITSPDGVISKYSIKGDLLISNASSGTALGSMSYVYNNDFAVTQSTVNGTNGNSTINFTYDKELKPLTAGAEVLAYDSVNSLLSSTALNSVKETFTQDTFGDLASSSAAFNTTALLGQTLTRDNLGRITAKVEKLGAATNTFAYVYDVAGRLSTVSKNGVIVSRYTYDTNSNRLTGLASAVTSNGTYDAQDRLLTYGLNTYTYNNNGEMISKAVATATPTPTPTPSPSPSPSPSPTPGQCEEHHKHHGKIHKLWKKIVKWCHFERKHHDKHHGHGHEIDCDDDDDDIQVASTAVVPAAVVPDQITQYSYDALGNLKSVTLSNGTNVSYLLDGQNRRVVRKVNGVVQAMYVYESQTRIAAVLDSQGNVMSRFVYGSKSNIPDYMLKGTSVYKIISDYLGSPRQVVDSVTGAVAQQMEFDEFGNVLSDSSPGFQPFGFAGGLYDLDSKLTHFGAREYDAQIGRFITRDPTLFFNQGGTNLYSYTLSDPVNLVDVNGKNPILAAIIGTGVFVGAINAISTYNQPGANFTDIAKSFGAGFIAGAGSVTIGILTGGTPVAGVAGVTISGAGFVAGIAADLGLTALLAPYTIPNGDMTSFAKGISAIKTNNPCPPATP